MMYRNTNPLCPSGTFGYWNDLNNDGTCNGEAFFGLNNFGFIYEKDSYKPQTYYTVIGNNFKKLTLVSNLKRGAWTNSDTDSLTDWQEFDSRNSMLAWDSDNEPVLPTLKTVLKLKGDVRISNELTRELNGLDDYLDVVRVAPFLSDPTVEDTDSDGLSDDKDANPLHAFNSDFILTDNISEIPSNFNIDNKEQIAKEIYNTYSTYEKWEMRRDLGDFYRDAQLNVVGGPKFGYKNAAIFLNHFLENTGEDYYFDAREIIENTSNGHDVYIKNINNVMTLCEDTVVDELSFITNYNVRFPGINFTSGGSEAGDVNALDWQYCVGDADTVMAFNCTSNREMYTLTINYYILDYYDWKKGSETRGGLVTDGQMYMLHKAGRAKEYRVI